MDKKQSETVENRKVSSDSTPKRVEYVTSRECGAMRLLRRDGYSKDLLKMMFHVSSVDSVTRHVSGQCACNHVVPPYEG